MFMLPNNRATKSKLKKPTNPQFNAPMRMRINAISFNVFMKQFFKKDKKHDGVMIPFG
jgi:hypothetical protein